LEEYVIGYLETKKKSISYSSLEFISGSINT